MDWFNFGVGMLMMILGGIILIIQAREGHFREIKKLSYVKYNLIVGALIFLIGGLWLSLTSI